MWRLVFVLALLFQLGLGEWMEDTPDDRPPCATVCEEKNDRKAEECCRQLGFVSGYCRPWGVAHCLGNRSLRMRRYHKNHHLDDIHL